MNILVFNCGSSSLKYRLIRMPDETELAGGEAQHVGPPTVEPACIVHHVNGTVQTRSVDMPDHATAFQRVMELLAEDAHSTPDAVGHRLVHGGSHFNQYAIINTRTIEQLQSLESLAPLHNPPAIALIRACHELYPALPQTIVCDTAYHSTIPEYARTYALPETMRTHNGFRKYGFHGISHHYVAMEAARILNRPLDRLNAVSCHLGSGGASLCAIVAGQSVDNTMGYSPLQGLVMSTRCGDLDPSVCLQLMALNNGDVKSVEKTLNIQSGVLGLSHYTSDIRDVLKEGRTGAAQSHEEILTMQIYLWRIRKYLGAYLAVVGSTDTVIFTDTIGVTVPTIRWAICKDMEVFGVEMDADRNKNISTLPADIATPESRVRILVIATNEELAIARQSYMAFHEESEMCEKEGV